MFSAQAMGGPRPSSACQPFRFHSQANPPQTWQNTPSLLDPGALTEEEFLTREISRTPSHPDFASAYGQWLKAHPRTLSLPERRDWLTCILFYVRMDTDRDGTPDWNALVDGTPSRVLFPQDEDIDGDRTPNILDPAPFDRSIRKASPGRSPASIIPSHLQDERETVRALQEEIFRDYGILSLNHTDQHAPEVLRSFIFLMKNAFASTSVRGLRNLKLLYAFRGHDAQHDIAAFHPGAKAISIGGTLTYSKGDTEPSDPHILAALAHEIGHAFLFERISPKELRDASRAYGGWNPSVPLAGAFTLLSESFLSPYSGPKRSDFVSSYASRNIHEWFADSFAAAALKKLGESGLLGKNWNQKLAIPRKKNGDHWINYDNLSAGLRSWLEKKISVVSAKPVSALRPRKRSGRRNSRKGPTSGHRHSHG